MAKKPQPRRALAGAKHSKDRADAKAEGKSALVIDGATGTPDPTPPTAATLPLSTAVDVRREMCGIYRQMKGNQIEADKGGKLVWVLSQIGKMIELEDFERRIAELEERTNGGRQLPAPAARAH